jgi:hypothetical protein
MCTYLTEKINISGSGKGADGPRGDIALRLPNSDRCQASTGTEPSSISWHTTCTTSCRT